MKLSDMNPNQLRHAGDHFAITGEPFLAVKCLYRARRLAKSKYMRFFCARRAAKIIDLNDLGNFNTRLTEDELAINVELWENTNADRLHEGSDTCRALMRSQQLCDATNGK